MAELDRWLEGPVSVADAAAMLAVSRGRVRQLVSDGEFGPGHLLEGARRGAVWPRSAVLGYAMRSRRRLANPIPALVPNLSDEAPPRYQLGESGYLELPVGRDGETGVFRLDAWRPGVGEQCGHPEPTVVTVTPIWPALSLGSVGPAYLSAFWGGFEVKASLEALADQSLELLGIHDESRVALCAVPIVEEFSRPPTFLDYLERDSGSWSEGSVSNQCFARCLGLAQAWFWPNGTNTRAHTSAWRPGLPPVTVGVLAQDANNWAAANWLVNQGRNGPTSAGEISWDRRAWHSFALALLSVRQQASSQPKESVGAGPAAVIVPAALDVEEGDRVDWTALLDALLTSPELAPAWLSAYLLSYVGDPMFSRPQRVNLDSLPAPWPELILASMVKTPDAPGGARFERLVSEAQKFIFAQGAGEITVGHIAGGPVSPPAVLAGSSILWCPSTAEEHDDLELCPSRALPSDPVEVLLCPEQISGGATGWIHTAAGGAYPLPGRPSPAMMATTKETWVAALQDYTVRPAEGLIGVPEPFSRVIDAAASEPLAMSWQDFQGLTSKADHGGGLPCVSLLRKISPSLTSEESMMMWGQEIPDST